MQATLIVRSGCVMLHMARDIPNVVVVKFYISLLKISLLVAFLPAWACAVSITITGEGSSDGTWDVTTVTGTFNTSQGQIEAQEWWGDRALAIVFANELGASLGTPNNPLSGLYYGPYLGYDPYGSHNTWFIAYRPPSYVIDSSISNTFSGTWAVATRAAVPDTGSTAALLGVGVAALAFARRRLG